MLGKILVLVLLSFSIRICYAVTPQSLHISFMLINEGRKEEARNVLKNSFASYSFESQVVADAFVDWVAHYPSQMNAAFDKASYYIVKGKK